MNALPIYIESITPRGILSFGPDTPPLKLGPLNVLIGPNGSGKSNLLDVLRLIRATPVDLQEPILRGGGVEEWIWMRSEVIWNPSLELTASIVGFLLQHKLDLIHRPFENVRELRVNTESIDRDDQPVYRSDLRTGKIEMSHRGESPVETDFHEQHRHNQSGLMQFRSSTDYFEITLLSQFYNDWRIYDAWQFGRDNIVRSAQQSDLRGDRLEENFANLFIFLSQLGTSPEAKSQIVQGMADLYPRFVDYEVVINAGAVQLFFTEKMLGQRRPVPAVRLSDGSLRYLCLLGILYNPNSSPLVCIEEPELGLHPDLVVRLAKHLQAASEHMQLIVTTHSDILIDALTDTPESIVVFENDNGSTQMNRLNRDDLSSWLVDYRLGELWTSGQIGGTRW